MQSSRLLMPPWAAPHVFRETVAMRLPGWPWHKNNHLDRENTQEKSTSQTRSLEFNKSMNFGPGTGWCQRCCAGWQCLSTSTRQGIKKVVPSQQRKEERNKGHKFCDRLGAGSGNLEVWCQRFSPGTNMACLWSLAISHHSQVWLPFKPHTIIMSLCRCNTSPIQNTSSIWKWDHNEMILYCESKPTLVVSLGEVASNYPEHMSWCLKTASHRGLQLSQPSSWPHLN